MPPFHSRKPLAGMPPCLHLAGMPPLLLIALRCLTWGGEALAELTPARERPARDPTARAVVFEGQRHRWESHRLA
eukprot:7251495-Pyramimonas_sp.AAC.1